MYLKTQQELNEFCDKARAVGRFGFDTEFVRDRTYYPTLALIQLVVDTEIRLVDPLADLDLSVLKKLFLDAAVVKVVHAGKQDLELIYYWADQVPTNVVDTQLAAALVGLGNQVSYAKLVESQLSITLSKASQYTNWLRRPLSSEQEEYAADDVRYLLPMQDSLLQQIEDMGRTEALYEELARLTQEDKYRLDPQSILGKVKGSRGLKGSNRAVAMELSVWREERAQKRNLPRRWVMPDDALVAIAKGLPTTMDALQQIRGLNRRDLNYAGKQILKIVAQNKNETVAPKQVIKGPRLDTDGGLIADCAFALLKVLCKGQTISPVTVATASEVADLVRYHCNNDLKSSNSPLLSGWRYESFGRPLIEFLDGKSALRVDPVSKRITTH